MRLGGPRRRLTTLGTLDHSLLILLDPEGETELEENDDYGGLRPSSIQWAPPNSGTYYLW